VEREESSKDRASGDPIGLIPMRFGGDLAIRTLPKKTRMAPCRISIPRPFLTARTGSRLVDESAFRSRRSGLIVSASGNGTRNLRVLRALRVRPFFSRVFKTQKPRNVERCGVFASCARQDSNL
jgi:hypothetical protein